MPEIIYKQLECETELTKGKNGDEYFIATISTGDVDRDGDIIEPKGLDTTHYNNAVLYRHNRTPGATAEETLPVGRSLWVKSHGNKVKAAVQFHQKTKLSQLLHEFYKEKLMKDWSIGFMTVEGAVELITNKDGAVTGRHIKKSKLHEFSSVPIGSNQFTDTQIVRAKEIQKELGISDEAYLELFKEDESANEKTDEEIQNEAMDEIDKNIDNEVDTINAYVKINSPEYDEIKSDITELKNEILILSKKVNDLIEIVTKAKEQKEPDITYPDDYLEFEGFGDSSNSGQKLEQTGENGEEVVLELFDNEEDQETQKEE